MTHDMNTSEFEPLNQRSKISSFDDGRMIGSNVRVIVGIVIAAAVGDDAVILRKRVYLRLPHAVVIESSMHKNNWDALAPFQIVQLNAVDSHSLQPAVLSLSDLSRLR